MPFISLAFDVTVKRFGITWFFPCFLPNAHDWVLTTEMTQMKHGSFFTVLHRSFDTPYFQSPTKRLFLNFMLRSNFGFTEDIKIRMVRKPHILLLEFTYFLSLPCPLAQTSLLSYMNKMVVMIYHNHDGTDLRRTEREQHRRVFPSLGLHVCLPQ